MNSKLRRGQVVKINHNYLVEGNPQKGVVVYPAVGIVAEAVPDREIFSAYFKGGEIIEIGYLAESLKIIHSLAEALEILKLEAGPYNSLDRKSKKFDPRSFGLTVGHNKCEIEAKAKAFLSSREFDIYLKQKKGMDALLKIAFENQLRRQLLRSPETRELSEEFL